MMGDSGKARFDVSSVTLASPDVIASEKIPGSSEIPNEGFLVGLSPSSSVRLSDGFPGNWEMVPPLESVFLSMVMFSSNSFDDCSGFPLWFSKCPFLTGFK